MADQSDRTVKGPSPELLTDQEAAHWLRLHIDRFRELVKDGRLPPPDVEISRQEKFWQWDTIWCTGRLLGFLLKRPISPADGGKSSPPTGG